MSYKTVDKFTFYSSALVIISAILLPLSFLIIPLIVSFISLILLKRPPLARVYYQRVILLRTHLIRGPPNQ